MTSPLEIEKAISEHLQKTITFSIETKILKKGKLILFCIKDFYLVFTLSIGSTKKVFELPYPFNFRTSNKRIYLDYSIKTFTHNIPEIFNLTKLLTVKKPNKLFNSYAEIVELSK